MAFGLPTFQAEIPKDSYCILLRPANNSSVPLNSSIQSLELKESWFSQEWFNRFV